jgi:hypothetical protein
MLKLSERTPDAINASEADNRLPGFPTTVHWPAEDPDGKRVMVLIGFDIMNGEAINAILAADREMIETIANQLFKPGQSEVAMCGIRQYQRP